MTKVITCTIKQARPNDGEIEGFWKLYRASQRVEDRWCQNTVPLIAEELSNTNLSRQEKMFLLRAWQVLVDGSGGFGRFMGAFDTYVYNFQDAGDDCVALKPSLQEIWSDGELLPVVLEAYEEAKQDGLVNWEAAASLNVESEELKRKVAASVVRLPDLNAALIEILGRPNFHCSPVAQCLRIGGAEIPRKSENEQAACIHWMLGLYLEHGESWRTVARDELKRIADGMPVEGE